MASRFPAWFVSGPFLLLFAVNASAQVPLDRIDPAVQQQSLPIPPQPAPGAPPPLTRTEVPAPAAELPPVSVARIALAGNEALDAALFDPIFAPYLRRPLVREDLQRLVRAVGDRARAEGYVFATASVDLSQASEGLLQVRLDEGRVDAVRVLGTTNPVVERTLQRLVTGRPVRQVELERAILLAGDVPGIYVAANRYVREGGFGILLVEVSETRAAFYGQIDNRGSDEIGPIRTTAFAALRSAFTSGDEVELLAANTPLAPREFLFLQARYGAPVDSAGGTLSTGASFGRTNPGASLRRLGVYGHSYDIRVAYQRPLRRSRAASLWANVEFRGAISDQSLSGIPIREDRIATLTGSLLAELQAMGGVTRMQGDLLWGLPLKGTTERGDRLASRIDGSARFLVAHALVDWTADLNAALSLRLAAEGQLASRPLLAPVELGAGGPAFARAYDYGERTGDQGILGAAELRFDLDGLAGAYLRRVQPYVFVDGGYVDNLQGGIGGGSLASAGAGIRFTVLGLDSGLELAAPLNSDRLDTADRSPRFTARMAVSF